MKMRKKFILLESRRRRNKKNRKGKNEITVIIFQFQF